MTTGIINKKRYFFVFLMTASMNLYATSWKSDRSDNANLEQYQSDRRFAYPIIPESQNHHLDLRHEDHRLNTDFQCDKAKKSSWGKMEYDWDYVYSEGDVNKNCFEFKKYPCLSRDTLEIISKPVVSIEKDETYKYQVIAKSNNENAKHIYSLSHAPKGMKIDPHSGLIVWKPTEDYYPPSANTPLSCSKIKHNFHDAIYYSDFSDLSAIKLNGRSRKLNSMAGKPILRLTDGSLQSSHVLFKNPIRLASMSGFASAFSFQNTNAVKFHSNNKQSRNGIALTFQGEKAQPSRLDGDIDDDIIHEALKIEFNTKINAGSNKKENNIDIKLNGSEEPVNTVVLSEDFNNGKRWFVWVDYLEEKKNLEVRLSDKPARPEKSLVTYQTDLNMLRKAERGYIGFTAVTGSYESVYDLYNWSFINSPPASEISPDLISNIASVEENTHVNAFIANFGKEKTKENYITSLYNGAPGRGGKVLSSYQTPVTKPGDELSFSFPLPPLSELKKDIYVIADSTNRVPECNEENNISKAAVVWVKATDNYGGSDRQIFIITVGSEKAKESVSLSTQEDVEVNYNINSHSNNNEIISQPENGIVTFSDGILVYKPNRDFNGEDHLTIKTDHIIDISIKVEPVNDAPLAHDLIDQVAEDSSVVIAFSGSDIENNTLTYSIVTPPVHGQLEQQNDNIIYIPDHNYNGSDTFAYIANDSYINSDKAIYSINVTPVNDAPVADNLNTTLQEDTAARLSLSALDVDGDVLAYHVVDLPEHGSLVKQEDGGWLYTPQADYYGEDGFTYIAADGNSDSNIAKYTLTISAVNDKPQAEHLSLSVSEDNDLAFNLKALDIDGSTFDYKIVTPPLHGILEKEAERVVYKPASNYFGLDSFEYVVNDGELDSASALVNINVDAVNDKPSADAKYLSVEAGDLLSVLLSGSDVENDPLSFEIVQSPLHGSLQGDAGSLSYIAENEYAGEDLFSYIANDGKDKSEPAVVSIHVVAKNKPPVITSSAVKQIVKGGAYLYKVEAVDPEKEPLKYELIQFPDGMLINAETGVISWRVVADSTLTEVPVSLRVTDAHGLSAEQQYVIRVDDLLNACKPQDAISFNFDNFENFGDLQINKNAQVVLDSKILRLTPHAYNQAGSAFMKQPIPLVDEHGFKASFSTFFSFRISNPGGISDYDGVGADGLAFVIQTVSNNVGGSGGGIGYAGIPQSLGIEFDTYNNSSPDQSNGNHIGIDINGDVKSVLLKPFTQKRLNEGDIWYAWVDYDGDKQNLEVRIASENKRPSDAFIQYKIDLVPVLQTENAYMGFTSGTGSAWGDHDILSWQFINTYTPIGECGLPYFTSIPTQLIQSGQTYVYEPAVSNKMQGHYVLNGPEGMSINPETGIVSWVVTNSDIGDHPVTVQYVTDSGKQAEQKYTLKVINASASDPAIISQPDGSVIAGNVFVYALSATDPNKTGLVWRIVDGPKGLALTNQQISWQTEKADIGKHSVSVEAMDAFALRDTQTFTIDVLSANKKPVIQSSPALTAVNAQQYEYVITATDPEGGVLHYDLLTAPEGMSITADGKISWIPVAAQTNQSFAVSVSVADNDDGITVQEWNIAVSDRVNHAPVISSTPPAQLMAGQAYSYTVEVSDPDGDSYTVVLAEAPAGMTLENNVVSWTPSTTIAAGNYAVKLVVRDDLGAETIQTFTLIVSKTPSSNSVPVITSEPETVAHPGIQYTYQLQATDAESDPLTYLLVAGPASASLSSSGKLIWTPATSDTGSYSFRLSVSDGIHTVLQTFNVSVSLSAGNQGGMPVITSVPEFFNVKTGVNYEYTIQATDPENNPLTYALIDHPDGMTITQQGTINWIPSDSQQGTNAVRLSVSDGVNTSYQSFSINVVADTPAVLNINLNQERDTIPAGESVTFQVAATGGTAPVTLALSLDGLNVSLDENHSAVLSPSTPGTHTVIVEAVDSEGYRVTQTAYIHVKDASDTQVPDVSISSPEDLTVVKGIISVQGKVSDANLVNYKLYLSPRGKKNWQELSSGNSDIDGEITQLDPSVLANGLYDLVLQATDINGQQNSDSIVLDISGDLKVGNFSVSYKDLDIPMSGIPMQVTRTYDSRRRAEQLDFGYGWSVDYQNIKIEESRDPGKGWALNQYNRGPYGVFVDFCVEPLGAPVVKVTLPDGKQEKFEAEASPRCNTYQPIIDVDVGFKAVGDTQSTLEILDGKHTRLVNGHLVETNYFSDPLNPSKYKLTTKTGYQYYLDQKFGIEKVITPNNQTITYSADGIIHSDGESILFTRDAGGRITAVTDPKGNVYKYTYTSAGDLGAVTSPLNDSDKTSFQYNSTHGLVDILDPLGRRLIRNIYDDSGRLIAQEDNQGQRKTFSHDIAGRQSVVTDRNNNTTLFYSDEDGNITTKIDAEGHSWAYQYDVHGNQLKQIDPLGQATSATFDERNNQLTQTNGEGNTVSYTYNIRGQELNITDAKGNQFANTYDSVGNLLTVTNPEGKVAGNNINAKGLVSSSVDVLGNETQFTYDDKGRKLTETNVLGHVSHFSYDDNGNLLSETRTRSDDGFSVNETTSYTYDALNRQIAVQYPDGSVSHKEYDLAGNVVAEIDVQGNRTEHDYDAYGHESETRYPDGSAESHTYDAEGNQLTVTNRMGRTTSYQYDGLNRVIQTRYPDGSVKSVSYDAAGRIETETNGRGNSTHYSYDAAGRRVAIMGADGHQRTFIYDANGNLISETDANGHVTKYEYNALDQRVRTLFHDGTAISETFDALGRRTSQTDATGKITTFGYDKLGRLIEVTDPKGQKTQYTYDEAGNKLTQTDANGHVTRWSYDHNGNVLSRILPLGQLEQFTYDAAGNVLTHTDFNHQTTSYQYDVNSQVIQIAYADGTTEHFTYDAEGDRLSASNAQGTTNYEYDAQNRLAKESQPDGTVLSYDYDAQGNRTQVTVTTGSQNSVTRYTYDSLNRLSSVIDAQNEETHYSYDAVGNRTEMKLPNGITALYSYDTRNRLTALRNQTSAGQLLSAYQYQLDAAGRRTQVAESPAGQLTTYQYDELNRLISETVSDPAQGNYTAEYSYDAVGNRTYSTIDGVQTAYRYDENDRLMQQGGTIYSYDDNGNTLSESGDESISYRYDAANHLIQFDKNGATTRYGYNTDGIRNQVITQGQATTYIVDSNREYAEVLGEVVNGHDTVSYTHGDELLSQRRNGQKSYPLYDGHGSVRGLSDVSGLQTDSYDYDAFGVTRRQSGSSENAYLYAGEQFDKAQGRYYLRARYYNQVTGRFDQMDSFNGWNEDPITLHKYLYANVDPVNGTDPSGHMTMMQMSAGMGAMGILMTVSSVNSGRDFYSALNSNFGTYYERNDDRERTYPEMEIGKIKARICAQSHDAECRASIPLLFLGQDHFEQTKHVLDAQFEGKPAVLSYQYPGNYRSWTGRQKECQNKAIGQDCDEYPYASTTQGGYSNYKMGMVSLRVMDSQQNQKAGTQLGLFYSACGVRTGKEVDKWFGVIASSQTLATHWSCGK